ncbi:MAG: efflux RND transporter periplasmic adaptor subunit [Desulfobulbus sp.]|jgi:membrane fusion protein (multidrug efflux system)|uniref:efflux RND transporter periplasmic adaptor subunit n=1 Tax=Desulfobulbus sp. TaxID=895 RepID=UPI002846DB42|nr:efflux RND transporter periplasmic adaptor subunit [Desulfobulbus sp.]MDR2549650.1 efflux RND transporter periplasmic adaptor subunit [Desulfobulbus sp.]
MKIKPLLLGIGGIVVVVGLLAGAKALQIGTLIKQGEETKIPPEVVAISRVQQQTWESLVTAVGSLEAVQGVTVAAELTGKVVAIAFEPGAQAKAGDLLVQQDIAQETAQLRAAEAAAALARVTFERAKKMLETKVVAEANYDNAEAQLKQSLAQADTIRAIIAKKTIRAPFGGRLGIRQVHIGQIIKEGTPIVSLQALDPIFVNFLVPQQQLDQVRPGYPVRIASDGLPAGQVVTGAITAVNPEVDTASRNLRVQATVANQGELLRPGMFVNVAVVQPQSSSVLAIPATAVLYAPYSDSVFIVEQAKAGEGGPADGQVVRQQFVRLGEKRGDFVAIASGLAPEQTVVATGVFKLRNGQAVAVDNSLLPEFELAPQPKDD